MTDQTYDSALARAAERCGVELRFWDIFGREHTASRSALQRIVGSLGIPTDSAESMVGAFEQRDRADWARLVAPCVIVTRDGEPLSVPITVPERALVGKIRYRLTVEDGTTLEGEAPLARAPGEAHLFEEPWVRAAPEKAARYGVAAINRALAGILGPTIVHICLGYGHLVRNKPSGYAFLPQLADSLATQVSLEAAQPHLDLGAAVHLLGDQRAHPEPLRRTREQLDRLGADAAGAAEDGDAARCRGHCHRTTPRPSVSASKAATGAAASTSIARTRCCVVLITEILLRI